LTTLPDCSTSAFSERLFDWRGIFMEARVGIEPPFASYLLELQDLTIARIDRNCTDLLVSVQFRTKFAQCLQQIVRR